MRVALLTVGSQGDVRPFVALGARLRAAGHDARLAADADFAPLAAAYGLPHVATGAGFNDFLRSPAGLHALRRLRRPVLGLFSLSEILREPPQRLMADAARACAGAQAIVCSTLARIWAEPIALAARLPLAIGHLMPDIPTGRFAHPMFPQWPLGVRYNRWSHHAAGRLIELGLARHRRRWGGRGARQPVRPLAVASPLQLLAVSPAVVERPADWPDNAAVTGYWLTAAMPYEPPPALARLLDGGAPVVYFGFGSMPEEDAPGLERMLVDALAAVAARAVVVRGLSALFRREQPPGNIVVLDAAPHGWLLPRVQAAVHHGGAGTTAACLQAGVPQVVVPFGVDQPFWGAQMLRLGAASACLPRRSLRAGALGAALAHALRDPGVRSRAAGLGARLREEDGTGRAVALLEASWLSPAPRGPARAASG